MEGLCLILHFRILLILLPNQYCLSFPRLLLSSRHPKCSCFESTSWPTDNNQQQTSNWGAGWGELGPPSRLRDVWTLASQQHKGCSKSHQQHSLPAKDPGHKNTEYSNAHLVANTHDRSPTHHSTKVAQAAGVATPYSNQSCCLGCQNKTQTVFDAGLSFGPNIFFFNAIFLPLSIQGHKACRKFIPHLLCSYRAAAQGRSLTHSQLLGKGQRVELCCTASKDTKVPLSMTNRHCWANFLGDLI